MKFIRLLRDIIVYSTVVLRRNTLCRLGIHTLVDEVETLALGEKLTRPKCTVFRCGYTGEARLEIPNDGKDGHLFMMNHTTGALEHEGRVSVGEIGIKRVDTGTISEARISFLRKLGLIRPPRYLPKGSKPLQREK